MIYADKIFDIDTLTKIRGQLLGRCWHEFSTLEPFCEKDVGSIVNNYFRQTTKNSVKIDQPSYRQSEYSELE